MVCFVVGLMRGGWVSGSTSPGLPHVPACARTASTDGTRSCPLPMESVRLLRAFCARLAGWQAHSRCCWGWSVHGGVGWRPKPLPLC